MSHADVYVGSNIGPLRMIALMKGDEQYVFIFDVRNRAECLNTLGQYASDPDLSFNWYDASILAQYVREDYKPQKPTGGAIGRILSLIRGLLG